jgi:predicted lipoprotein with Yx(FWY)xxD motif
MKRTSVLVCAALLATGLAFSGTATGGRAASSAAVVVKVAVNKKLKKSILVDGRGMTLYLFTLDLGGKPTCVDDPSYHCVKAWIPLRATSAPHAGAGAKQSLLGLVKRPDGGMQVTYNHHPLYYFHGGPNYGAGDKKPGDAKGQFFAGIWFVVSPQGAAIRAVS